MALQLRGSCLLMTPSIVLAVHEYEYSSHHPDGLDRGGKTLRARGALGLGMD